MPYVKAETNARLSPQQKDSLLRSFTEHIPLLPGRLPERTMAIISDGQSMYFNGSDDPCMKITVEVFGTSDSASKGNYAAAVTKAAEEFASIPPERVYLTYFERDHWAPGGVYHSAGQ